MRRLLNIALSLSLVVGLTAGAVTVAFAAPSSSSTYELSGNGLVALAPARLLDTRAGAATIDARFAGGGAVSAGTSAAVTVLGRGGVPDSGVAAVVVNVTGTVPTSATFLTVFPTGDAVPTASSLNLVAGETSANLAVVKVGASGQVSVFNAGGFTHVLMDVTGYYPTGTSFTAMAPQRLLDTRVASSATTIDGLFQGIGPVTRSWIDVQVTGRAGIPTTGVGAVVLNLTGIATASTFVTAYPSGEALPNASTLNLVPGAPTPNLTVVKLGTGGMVRFYSPGAATDLIADVAGWIPTGSSYQPITPARFLDTRAGTVTTDGQSQATGPVGGGQSVTIPLANRAGIPDAATAVIVNVTAITPTQDTFVTAFPAGQAVPNASNINPARGAIRPNLVLAKLGSNHSITLFNAGGSIDLVVDLLGYVMPPLGVTMTHDQNTLIEDIGQVAAITPATTSGGTGTVTLTGTPPTVGQYVYLPPGGTNGNGVIGKVTDVTGQTATVVNVPLTEAFTEGHIEGTSPATASVASSAAPANTPATTSASPAPSQKAGPTVSSAQVPSPLCTIGKGLAVDVSVSASFVPYVLFDWGPFQTTHFRATLTTTLQLTTTLSVSSTLSCNLPKLFIDVPFTPIGPFVPTVQSAGEVYVDVATAYTTTVTHSMTTGVDWLAGSTPTLISTIAPVRASTKVSSAAVTSTAGGVAWGPQLAFLVAGLAGPAVKVQGFLELSISDAIPWGVFKWGIKVGVSLDLNLLVINISVTLAETTIYEHTIWDSGTTPYYPPPPPTKLAITTTSLPLATAGSPYTTSLTGSGGTVPYAWTATGLPPGLTLDHNTGTITGTPTTPGTYPVTLTLAGATGQPTTTTLTLTVDPGTTPEPPIVTKMRVGITSRITFPVRGSGGSPDPTMTWLSAPLPGAVLQPAQYEYANVSSAIMWGPIATGSYPWAVRESFPDGSIHDSSGTVIVYAVPAPSLALASESQSFDASGIIVVDLWLSKTRASDTTPSARQASVEDPASDVFGYVDGDANSNGVFDLGEQWHYQARLWNYSWWPTPSVTRTVLLAANDGTGAPGFVDGSVSFAVSKQ